MSFDPKTTAVLIVDLQNDFLDPKGAYGRAGQSSPEIAALPSRILPLLNAIRKAGGWVFCSDTPKYRCQYCSEVGSLSRVPKVT